MWRPKNPKAVTIIKLTCWAGILTWMVFFFAYAVIAAQRLGAAGPFLFGTSFWGQVLTWVTPIWVIFTSLLCIVYIARFVNKKIGRRRDLDLEPPPRKELKKLFPLQDRKGRK